MPFPAVAAKHLAQCCSRVEPSSLIPKAHAASGDTAFLRGARAYGSRKKAETLGAGARSRKFARSPAQASGVRRGPKNKLRRPGGAGLVLALGGKVSRAWSPYRLRAENEELRQCFAI